MMKGKFTSIRLDQRTGSKLTYLTRKLSRSPGLTIRLLINVCYRLIQSSPELFIVPDNDIQEVHTNEGAI